MPNVLDGGWEPTPKTMTIHLPMPDGLFTTDTNAEVIADFLAGVAGRLAREQYLLDFARIQRDEAEGQATLLARQANLEKAAEDRSDPNKRHLFGEL